MCESRLLRTASLVLALVLLGAGCGGDDDADGGASDVTEPTAQDDGDGGDDGAPADDVDRCPLEAEQVGEVLGTTVERDGAACSFYPPGDFAPRALFVPLPPEVCEESVESMDSRLEPFDGLGVDAYALFAPGVPARIVVCADAAFDLSVENPDDEAAAEAAVEELARRILDGA